MTKYTLVLFSLILIAFSALAIHAPHSEMENLLTSTTAITSGRLLVALFFLTYALFQSVRLKFTRLGMGLLGIGLVAFAVAGVVSPTYFGKINYVMPLDTLFSLQGGVLALLASLELKPSTQDLNALDHAKDLLPNHSAVLQP
jgi:hypothetical protein